MEKAFRVSEIGDTTGEKWLGDFTCKTRLSHRDILRRDQRRRDLLGGTQTGPAPDLEAASTALVFAELAVRLVKTPTWWDASDGGLDLEDGNVVGKVYKEVMKAEGEVLEARAAAAAKGAEEIRTAAKADPDATVLPSSASLMP